MMPQMCGVCFHFLLPPRCRTIVFGSSIMQTVIKLCSSIWSESFILATLVASRGRGLSLQLRPFLYMSQSCGGLVSSSPVRPGEDVRGLDLSLSEPDGDASDFLDRPSDQGLRRRVGTRGVVFGGVAAFALYRITAIMAKASITNETWRCQPCQERVSL